MSAEKNSTVSADTTSAIKASQYFGDSGLSIVEISLECPPITKTLNGLLHSLKNSTSNRNVAVLCGTPLLHIEEYDNDEFNVSVYSCVEQGIRRNRLVKANRGIISTESLRPPKLSRHSSYVSSTYTSMVNMIDTAVKDGCNIIIPFFNDACQIPASVYEMEKDLYTIFERKIQGAPIHGGASLMVPRVFFSADFVGQVNRSLPLVTTFDFAQDPYPKSNLLSSTAFETYCRNAFATKYDWLEGSPEASKTKITFCWSNTEQEVPGYVKPTMPFDIVPSSNMVSFDHRACEILFGVRATRSPGKINFTFDAGEGNSFLLARVTGAACASRLGGTLAVKKLEITCPKKTCVVRILLWETGKTNSPFNQYRSDEWNLQFGDIFGKTLPSNYVNVPKRVTFESSNTALQEDTVLDKLFDNVEFPNESIQDIEARFSWAVVWRTEKNHQWKDWKEVVDTVSKWNGRFSMFGHVVDPQQIIPRALDALSNLIPFQKASAFKRRGGDLNGPILKRACSLTTDEFG